MLTPEQIRICDELVELYKAQLPFVEPVDSRTNREWTRIEIELYQRRAERIETLQHRLLDSVTVKDSLRVSHVVHAGSWGDR